MAVKKRGKSKCSPKKGCGSKKPVAKARMEMQKAKLKAKIEVKKAKALARRELALAKKKFMATEKKIKSQIERNPEKAALIAGAVGVALGAGLVAAMKKKKK